jgi:hypothetical protein
MVNVKARALLSLLVALAESDVVMEHVWKRQPLALKSLAMEQSALMDIANRILMLNARTTMAVQLA